MPSSRPRIRQLIKHILIRRLRLPFAGTNSTQLEQQRLKTIKKLTMRIETSLYHRSLSMDWYEDESLLEWRVIQIARELVRL